MDYKTIYQNLDESRPVTEFDISFRLEDAEEISKGLDLLPKKAIGFEIGTHNGASTYFMCSYHPGLLLYTLDMEPRDKFYLNLNGKTAIQLKGDSNTYVPDKKFDIIFIDGEHSYNQVKSDIQRFLPYLNKNGLIGGHDYDIPSVSQAVDELMQNYKLVAKGHSWMYQI